MAYPYAQNPPHQQQQQQHYQQQHQQQPQSQAPYSYHQPEYQPPYDNQPTPNRNNPPAASATYMPNAHDDHFSMPASQPVLVAPEPQRINPDMSNQIADGLNRIDLNNTSSNSYARFSTGAADVPHLSPFPKLFNKPDWVPPSDEEVEATLESARDVVLNSSDPEMQLAWAQDALTYVGVCADDEDRRRAAKPGTSRSQTPRVEHQLRIDAMSIVNFLADQHHPKAEFIKGMWLEWGRYGQREDKKEAFRCYSRAADRQYHRAHYRIGMLYESYNDPVKALRHYHYGVDAGDAASCYRMGMMILRGQNGEPQDFPRAVDLLRKSADAADENAAQGAYVYGMLLAHQLPQIHLPDNVLPYDEAGARFYIQKAAYLKFSKAQLKMGSMFELGSLGCDFSPSFSVHYNALASKQGEAEADMALSKWFLVGYDGIFPKNEELAYNYAERAAQSALPTAEFALGYFHEIGMHVPVDLDKAMEWYQKASRHGNTDAKGRIDGLSRKQVLNKSDHEKVAVNKIKSQRGSMIGLRPDRLQKMSAGQLPAPPSTILETHVTPSNGTHDYSPSVYSPSANTLHGSPMHGGDFTTPYPLDNGPPASAAPPVRPATVTPYPLDDAVDHRRHDAPHGPVGGFNYGDGPSQRPMTTLNPNIRPSSAFQIDPGSQRRPAPGGNAQYQSMERPSTVQPVHQNLGPSSRPPANNNNRIASGPPDLQAHSNGYRPATGSAAPLRPNPSLGYSAPIDPRRTGQPSQPGPRIPSGQAPSSSLQQSNASGRPMMDQGGPVGGGRTGTARPQPRPTEPGRKPVGNTPPQSNRPPNKDQSATAPAKPGARPPGTGPKTFEEMGVPAGKQESDCVVM